MSPPLYPCRFPHRVRATHDLVMVNGDVIPEGTLGWLVSFSHLWKEPNVEFDGLGFRGITSDCIQTIRENGRLIRRPGKEQE